jgi:hypothetical protein
MLVKLAIRVAISISQSLKLVYHMFRASADQPSSIFVLNQASWAAKVVPPRHLHLQPR